MKGLGIRREGKGSLWKDWNRIGWDGTGKGGEGRRRGGKEERKVKGQWVKVRTSTAFLTNRTLTLLTQNARLHLTITVADGTEDFRDYHCQPPFSRELI